MKLSGNGDFTKKCQRFFEEKYGFRKCLLTSSCTDALEMAAILADIEPGDEVIVPSYTFVSTANAFVLRGAKIVFSDSHKQQPNLDETSLESLITPKTKVIVVVHYAGAACNMEVIMRIANKYNILVVEDAAQAIDSYFNFSNGEIKALGSIGHLAAFSFHETKNIISGEGGMLVINDEKYVSRAEIIWEKGTNRSAFWRGEVDKYGWMDVGSSFLPSEITAAFLWAQLEELQNIQNRRKAIWQQYFNAFGELQANNKLKLPTIPEYGCNNAHMFYLVTHNITERDELIAHLKADGIHAVFHYISLHKSPFIIESGYEMVELPMAEVYTETLLRLPLYYDLSNNDVDAICKSVLNFYN